MSASTAGREQEGGIHQPRLNLIGAPPLEFTIKGALQAVAAFAERLLTGTAGPRRTS